MGETEEIQSGSKTDSLPKGRGITSGMLKIFACFDMLVDHIGAAVLYYGYNLGDRWIQQSENIRFIYFMIRLFGRLGFPIFCFLLVEGYFHTRNVWKYLRNLIIFGVISEIPFDLAINAEFCYMNNQNVYFTLALGLIMIIIFDRITKGDILKAGPARLIGAVLLSIIPITIGFLIKSDYGGLGVLLIFTFYLMKKYGKVGVFGIILVLGFINLSELFACFDFAIFSKYNGRRGISLKYFFYAFYPLHLLILVGIRYLIFGM